MRRFLKIYLFAFLTLMELFLCEDNLLAQDTLRAKNLLLQARDNMYSNPKKASNFASEAISLIAENETPNPLRAEAMLLYSNAEQLLGNFDLSIKNLYDTKKYLDTTNKKQEAQLYMLMGRVYSKLGDFQKGIEYNEEGLALFKALGDTIWIAASYNERGVLHCQKEEHEIAEQFMQRALMLNRSKHHLKGIATNLSNLCLYRGNFEEKLSLINEAITINKNLDAVWSLGENYNNMGRQYFFAGKYKEALQALEKANEYAQQIGARELICDNYEYFSDVYAAIGDFSKAYAYLSKMATLSRELQSSIMLRNIEQEIAHGQYLEQKHQNELSEQSYRIGLLRRNIWILTSILVMVVVGVLLWHRNEKKLKTVQNTLDDSRRETTSFAVFLKSRNEVLNKIRVMIKEGYKMDGQEIVPHLKRINAFISQCQNGEKRNSTLASNVAEKSDEFKKRLLERHPGLTPGEQYLATLLRVNLSTKEIASLTETTPKTVNMNRYRLRKSLGLASEDNLVEYLQSL